MNYDKSTYKAFSLNAEDLKEVVELVNCVSETNINYLDRRQLPIIAIKFFNGIKKDYQDLEQVLQLKNTSDNPIMGISVLSPWGANRIDFFFNSGGIAYRLDCADEEKFYFYQAKAEELISSLYENKIYNAIFTTGAIFFFIFILIHLFINTILLNALETSTWYSIFSLFSVAIYFFCLWMFMWREKKLFPLAFFLIGRGVERKENNIKTRKALLTSVPFTILGFIIESFL
ncbi:hypothetical protein [Desemzia sp. FAM 23989]|uniref:hypothetical protein n=1 Tax=Desemzia sp. FAM 23989 TaxID=3259523 RepID=UPI003885462D